MIKAVGLTASIKNCSLITYMTKVVDQTVALELPVGRICGMSTRATGSPRKRAASGDDRIGQQRRNAVVLGRSVTGLEAVGEAPSRGRRKELRAWGNNEAPSKRMMVDLRVGDGGGAPSTRGEGTWGFDLTL